MRPVKFRAFDKKQGKYLYWDLETGENWFWSMIKAGELEDPDMFVGKKDKNGKDMYESDLIKYQICETSYDKEPVSVGIVSFNPGKKSPLGFGARLWDEKERKHWISLFYDYEDNPPVIEIIGTIEENPEMLEGG